VASLRESLRKPMLRVVVAASSCAVLVSLSARLIDRPVSTWVHEHLGDRRFALFTSSYDGHQLVVGPFSLMAGPAQALGPLAVFVLAILAVAAASGWRPKMRGRVILALSLSVLAAIEINRETKTVFGRTWPESWLNDNPSWIRDGVFGFFPFHGGRGWNSFPSGHTTAITTPATLLWIVWPELRILWAAMVAIVMAGLIGANYHFVSDLIGGVYLGILVGLGIAGLILAPNDRLNWSILRNASPTPASIPPAIDESQPAPDQP
jgi:membrane-associated phospholipid phosphatase